MINKLHGLSPSGGLVSPSGGFASLFFDQVGYFASIKLCQALSRQGAIIKIPVVRCHYLLCSSAQWPDWGNSMTSKILDWKFKTDLMCVETIQYKEFWIVLTQIRRLFNLKDYENKKVFINNWNFLVLLADLFFSEILQVLVSLKLHNPTDPSWLLEVDLATWGRSLHSFFRANNYKIKLN